MLFFFVFYHISFTHPSSFINHYAFFNIIYSRAVFFIHSSSYVVFSKFIHVQFFMMALHSRVFCHQVIHSPHISLTRSFYCMSHPHTTFRHIPCSCSVTHLSVQLRHFRPLKVLSSLQTYFSPFWRCSLIISGILFIVSYCFFFLLYCHWCKNPDSANVIFTHSFFHLIIVF